MLVGSSRNGEHQRPCWQVGSDLDLRPVIACAIADDLTLGADHVVSVVISELNFAIWLCRAGLSPSLLKESQRN
jgi:hypothetical protein